MAAQGAQIVAEGYVAATAKQRQGRGRGRGSGRGSGRPCVSPKSEQHRWSKAAADAAVAAAVGGQEGSEIFSAPRSDSDPGLAGLACLSPRLVLM